MVTRWIERSEGEKGREAGGVVKKEKEDLGFCVVEEDGLSVYKDEDVCCPNTMAIDIERSR